MWRAQFEFSGSSNLFRADLLPIGFWHCHLLQDGWTSLHLASRNDPLDVAMLLLNRGANIEGKDKVFFFCVGSIGNSQKTGVV